MSLDHVIYLDGETLGRTEIEQIANRNAKVEIAEKSLEKVIASRSRIEKQINDGKVLYGVNTGFGKLSDIEIKKSDIEKLQLNLLRADAVGVGEHLPTEVVRAIMTLR